MSVKMLNGNKIVYVTFNKLIYTIHSTSYEVFLILKQEKHKSGVTKSNYIFKFNIPNAYQCDIKGHNLLKLLQYIVLSFSQFDQVFVLHLRLSDTI